MKLLKVVTGLLVITSCWTVFGATVSMDPLWIYKDLPDTEKLYGTFTFYDTCRTMSVMRIYPVDTGDVYDSNYINFNYQFSADTMRVRDRYDSNTVIYKDYRPGYAGYKIDWDGGVTGYQLAMYKYMLIAHKGPLVDHKVTIRFGYNTGCGTPTTFQTIGTFTASSAWKVDTITIPDVVRNISAAEIEIRNYYEMQVLITNADPMNTGITSAPGNLKVDNIAFAGKTNVAVSRTRAAVKSALGNAFTPAANGPVQLSAFSLGGELLYCTTVNVVAGQKYSIGSFVKSHAPSLSTTTLRCVRIRGAGVDVLQKVW